MSIHCGYEKYKRKMSLFAKHRLLPEILKVWNINILLQSCFCNTTAPLFDYLYPNSV